MEKRRRICSLLLLAVFLPAMLASFLHRHPHQISLTQECVQCVHHLPHQDHLNVGHGGFSECVLCQFLSLPFIAAISAGAVTVTAVRKACYLFSSHPHLAVHLKNSHTRAPPVLCIA